MYYKVDFYHIEISGLFYTSGRAVLRYRLCIILKIHAFSLLAFAVKTAFLSLHGERECHPRK